ncbi:MULTISPECIES: alanine--tRNA ligase [Aestuariimicrobium]|uniref:alanine--tRNA ligase n=1 Tax=Aestuariimicrobium TaxID=396388 RepID=UPI000429B475|nr:MULTISPECIES: alanine--tRNA ligase [Aestuariimicrobium]CAI9410030.1 Alanine--tRNA ligase [Aestuariimicrobium sp. T2.26MG-19.2B]
MKTAEVGRRYVEFFRRRGHAVVPSVSLVHNDPNLLFVVAGMVPMVPYFTGEVPAPWSRAVSVQKCIRTLDIDEVGKTTRHGTFFQMLGNFSFGDYFKAEVIPWTWEFLTGSVEDGNLGFDPDRISVSVLGPGFHPAYPEGDVEALEIWRSIGMPDERIWRRDLKENYWHMGVPGPGGPDSEVFFDRGPEFGPDGGPDVNDERYLEIWNNVFQQEELSAVRAKDDFDVARPLPTKNIDTGAGLERMATLLQGKHNLYEIDQVSPVIERAAELSGKVYGADPEDDVRLRVIADHVRSGLMLMSDGVRPGNEARGYVLRRLLRRSVRSMRLLGYQGTSLVDLLDVSRQAMSESYPEVEQAWQQTAAAAEAEEATFSRTLTSGTQLFETAANQVRADQGTTLSGEKAFQLHDTYGFPIDLTLEMAAEQGLDVDRGAFTRLMTEQRNRAKADARAKKTGGVSVDVYRGLREHGETPFLGYTDLVVPTRVRGIISDGSVVDHAAAGSVVEVVLAETPFYAESGGQDADAGVIKAGGFDLEVLDVQRPVPGLVVHKVAVNGDLAVGDQVEAAVDGVNRLGACQAHTATHVLHAALRELVGSGATQAGSYNKPGYLRFDYSAQAGLSDALRAEIEERCNVAIKDNLTITDTQMPLEQAKSMGAMAMFGEKYPAIVRMVEMGGPWSRELCGGTHVQTSSQIGLMALLGEQSIGSGARRVEALVSTDAFSHLAAERALVHGLTDVLKVQPEQLTDRVQKLVADLKQAEKQIAELRAAQLQAQAGQMLDQVRTVGRYHLLALEVPGVGGNDLRGLVTDLRGRLSEQAAVVAAVGGTSDKPALVVATTQAARELGAKAGQLVSVGTVPLSGRGGGKDDLAQGGGTNGAGAADALAAIAQALV